MAAPGNYLSPVLNQIPDSSGSDDIDDAVAWAPMQGGSPGDFVRIFGQTSLTGGIATVRLVRLKEDRGDVLFAREVSLVASTIRSGRDGASGNYLALDVTIDMGNARGLSDLGEVWRIGILTGNTGIWDVYAEIITPRWSQ